MNKILLDEAEIKFIKTLLDELMVEFDSVDSPSFLKDVVIYASELPRRLRRFLNDFKVLEPSGACVIAGYPIDDHKIGRTPDHWNLRSDRSSTLEEEILFVLFSSLLGDPIGWITQQDGYIIHNVVPIKGHENLQLSSGSQYILWHIEDAFHHYRGDYVSLMCLRNPDNTPTTFASIDMVQLDTRQIEILFEPRFIIRPDGSHATENNTDLQDQSQEIDTMLNSTYQAFNLMQTSPQKVSVLFGSPKSPYICIDPYLMDSMDGEAQLALDTLIQALDSKLSECVLHPGDFLFIDNYKTVHGRGPFNPRYDGTDRWLKRMNITRDLRKSRDSRTDCSSHIIY